MAGLGRIAFDQSSSLAAAARLTGYLDVLADHGEYMGSVNKAYKSLFVGGLLRTFAFSAVVEKRRPPRQVARSSRHCPR